MQTINDTVDNFTALSTPKPKKLWMPKRVVFTANALDEPFGKSIYDRISKFNLPIEIPTALFCCLF